MLSQKPITTVNFLTVYIVARMDGLMEEPYEYIVIESFQA